MAKLIITYKDKVLQEIEIARTITIGRETGDILIKNPAVSARHVKIEKSGAQFIAVDLNSTNGTFVNDERITQKELKTGDMITVGRHVLKFEDPEQQSSDASFGFGTEDLGGQTLMMDSSKIKAMMAAAGGPAPSGETQQTTTRRDAPKLFLMQPSGAPKVVRLEKESTMIGSSDTSDIQIKGLTIGRVAAVIAKAGDKYEITFQGGMAKLKVNGKQVDRQILANGDKFSIGSYNFEFRTEL
ncbi:MAG: FHA domain-containing protein [Nitrospinae bacterium]|nr:FHA domain-containing protein [Nitrospinota bacterium]